MPNMSLRYGSQNVVPFYQKRNLKILITEKKMYNKIFLLENLTSFQFVKHFQENHWLFKLCWFTKYLSMKEGSLFVCLFCL